MKLVVTKYLIEVAVEERIGESGGHPDQMTAGVHQAMGPLRPDQQGL